MRTLALMVVGGILIGWPTLHPVDAGPTRIEAEGTLVFLPAGKGRRVGIKNTKGTIWLATPTGAGSSLAKQVFHRLQRLPRGAYVKVSGVLLSRDPIKIGPDTIKSGKSETLTFEVARNGKTGTWADWPLRVHPLCSIPDNSPSGTETTSRAALLKHLKGKRITARQFTLSNRRGVPTDVFLDSVRAVATRNTKLFAYGRAKEPRKELLGLLSGADVWVSNVEGSMANVRFVVEHPQGGSTSFGGQVKLADLRFDVPKPKPAEGVAKGARGRLAESK